MFNKDLVILFIKSDKAQSHCISFYCEFLYATQSVNTYYNIYIPKEVFKKSEQGLMFLSSAMFVLGNEIMYFILT